MIIPSLHDQIKELEALAARLDKQIAEAQETVRATREQIARLKGELKYQS